MNNFEKVILREQYCKLSTKSNRVDIFFGKEKENYTHEKEKKKETQQRRGGIGLVLVLYILFKDSLFVPCSAQFTSVHKKSAVVLKIWEPKENQTLEMATLMITKESRQNIQTTRVDTLIYKDKCPAGCRYYAV